MAAAFSKKTKRSNIKIINELQKSLAEHHQISLNEIVQITVQDRVHIRGFVLRPQVFHHLVRMEHIAADLRSPLDFLLATFYLGDFLPLLFQLNLIELRF